MRASRRPQPRPVAWPGTPKVPLNGDRAPTALLAGSEKAEEEPTRVLVLTADIGEGHDLPARIIAAEVEQEIPGSEVEIANGLAAMGHLLHAVVCGGSKVTFRWMPWLFDIQYWLLARFAPTRWLAHRLGYWLGSRGLLRLIAEHDPDVVISTYPGVTAILGMLRQKRRLPVPAQSAITDLAGLHFWAHPGIDMHYVTHPESIEEVQRIAGPASVEWARPPISPDFLMPRTRSDARRALGVPAHARVILVSGGGWGVGDLEGAVKASLALEDTIVACLTGRNESAREKLEQRFGSEQRVRILGFTDQMSDWMAAADAMVHSTAGLTVLEAHIRGCPVVSYGFSVGHLRANNTRLRAIRPRRGGALRARARVGPAPRHQGAACPRLDLRIAALDRLQDPRRAAPRPAAGGVAPAHQQARHRRLDDPDRDDPDHRRRRLGQLGHALPGDREADRAAPSHRQAGANRRPRAPVRSGRRAGREMIRAAAGASLAGAAVIHAGPALAPVVPGVGPALGLRHRIDRAGGVALTFDDGPHPQGTERILEALREAGARRPSSWSASRSSATAGSPPRSSPPGTA